MSTHNPIAHLPGAFIDLQVRIVGEGGAPDPLPLPDYHSHGAAGLDLRAAIREPELIMPAARAMVSTGIAIALPSGFEGQIRPRSGLAWTNGITVLNSPGTVDEDYRGELRVVLINHGSEPFTIRRGDRIAQLVVAPVTRVRWKVVAALPSSGRGSGGYGSTGRLRRVLPKNEPLHTLGRVRCRLWLWSRYKAVSRRRYWLWTTRKISVERSILF